ncbi:MAG: hypothetical protein Q3X07_06495, partial [Gemmiger sp.]|nr:hypothetical protein [Gemmiger sp.]
ARRVRLDCLPKAAPNFYKLCRRHGDSPSLLFILYSLFFVLLSQTAELVYHKRRRFAKRRRGVLQNLTNVRQHYLFLYICS